jgi:pimeloyl-ACP methyl ester carboxylesterase
LLLALAACGGVTETRPATVEATPDASEAVVVLTQPIEPPAAEPTAAASSAVGFAEVMTITAADELPIQATLLTPLTSGVDPGVILLHMLGDDRTVWGEVGLTADLVAAGYAVLAVDMRGHGKTGGAQDWALAADDLGRVWDAFAALETVDEARTAVVGASIGANMALRLGADRSGVAAVALLSPGLEYRGVTTEDQPVIYGDRPLLLVSSEDDAYSADSVRALAAAANGATVQMYDNAGHGTNMFAAEPELAGLIIGWLDEQLAAGQ